MESFALARAFALTASLIAAAVCGIVPLPARAETSNWAFIVAFDGPPNVNNRLFFNEDFDPQHADARPPTGVTLPDGLTISGDAKAIGSAQGFSLSGEAILDISNDSLSGQSTILAEINDEYMIPGPVDAIGAKITWQFQLTGELQGPNSSVEVNMNADDGGLRNVYFNKNPTPMISESITFETFTIPYNTPITLNAQLRTRANVSVGQTADTTAKLDVVATRLRATDVQSGVELNLDEDSEYFWTNPAGGKFNVGANWDDGQAPESDVGVVFDQVNSGYVVTMDVNPSVASLRVPQGTVSLDFLGGAGELLDVDGDVIVGETAGVRGGLDVIGGRVEARDVLVGGSTGADALVTLREGATLDWTGELRLGGAEGASSAQLFAISGAQANVNSVATVGRGGEWTATSLSVGEDRPGAFNVLAGGRVELSQFLDVAEDGEMLVQGDGDPSSAQVVVNGNLVLQDGGGLRVASGGRVNVGSLEAASEVYLNSVSGEGEPAAALIEGDESFLFAIGDLHVGYAIVGEEHGELEIRDGADVIAFGSLSAGQEGGNDSGRILVDGPNSNLLVEAARIGNVSSHESRLDVHNGATVDVNVGDLLVDSSGRVAVDGVTGEHRSQLKTKASVVAARGAEIVVSQGGLLAAGDIDSTEDAQNLVVGASADGPANPARLLVQDANSRAITFGSLRVGDALNAPGVVEVTGGGELIALGDLHIGRNGVATKGELTASGEGSVVLAGEGFVGFDGATTPDLTSRLSASDGAVVTLVERLVVLDNGTVDVSGGGSVYIGGEGGAPVAGKVVIGPDGELWGTGAIVGDRDNQGGVDNYGMAYPGQSPGVLTIDGDYYQAPSGGLVIEVTGDSPGAEYDVLKVAGDAVIEGKVAFEFLNGFAPRQGDAFEFLDVDGTLDLASAAFTITNLAKGFEYDLAASGSGYQLTALNDAQFRFAADFVLDGQVDLLDFNTLKANFGALDATQDDGDANDDGVVDLIDFNLLKGQFGASVAVPEPNSLTISATGMLFLFALRRRQLG